MENKINQKEKATELFQNLLAELEKSGEERKKIDKVEIQILHSLLQIGKKLVESHIDSAGKIAEETQTNKGGYQNKGLCESSYTSIFGNIDYQLKKYYIKKKGK